MTVRIVSVLSLALVVAACGDDESASTRPDAGVSTPPEADAGGDPDAGPEAPPSRRTEGPNRLDAPVWRFAIIPDTQGRDDDKYRASLALPDGSTTSSGWDVNRDGIYDGEGYRIDVSNRFQPVVVVNDAGAPIEVPEADRRDYPVDFKHLPLPLVEPMIAKIIDEDVDLVLAVGDITDYRSEHEYVQWMTHVAEPLTAAGVAVYPVRGNHEIVDGRDWNAWFATAVDTRDKKSVNNVDNGIDAYAPGDHYDQGYKLYSAYAGRLLADGLAAGDIVGYPGLEDLIYYFFHDNTLFIGIDFYFSELISTDYRASWIYLYPWLENVLDTHGPTVDHVVVYGHEALSTKKRPHVYDEDQYSDYLASLEDGEDGGDAFEGALGLDIGQLGHLETQSDSRPGLTRDVLALFAAHDVLYIGGHDHQYSRSRIHSVKGDRRSPSFTQIIAGNASWKSYNDRYGVNDAYETGLSQDNHTNADTEKTTRVSFVIVEVRGRMVTTTNWYAEHSLSEDDMTRGARWDREAASWNKPVDGQPDETIATVWKRGDTARYTSDGLRRLIGPVQNYWATTTVAGEGYVGTAASVLEGYNLTYNSHEVFAADSSDFTSDDASYTGEYASAATAEGVARRVDHLSELMSLSWFADDDAATVSDVLMIDGTLCHDGTYDNTNGVAQSYSLSETFFDKDGIPAVNPTAVSRDGVITAGDDFADAMAIAISAPDGVDLRTLTIARYDDVVRRWVDAMPAECFIDTGYSDDFSVMYRNDEGQRGDGPEGGEIPGCGLRYWGYNHNARAVWGFVHRPGRYALIAR